MSSAENGKLVWITRHQRDCLALLIEPEHPVEQALVAAWDAAPADPARAIEASLWRLGEYGNSVTKAVLAALGYPPGSRDGSADTRTPVQKRHLGDPL